MALSTTIGQPDVLRKQQSWEEKLDRTLPLFGHRNWIVIADAAYPAQSNPGIETIVADTNQIHAVETVLNCVAACAHIRANIYTDRELDYLEERDAPGIAGYRKQLQALLQGAAIQQLPHEEIIAKLDQCAQLFSILLIKTDMTLPYTSVFIELDCGYWNAEAEDRLRKAMQR
jgi:L-fucose mutarotase/ribose pyranase (RbsD/FucU family)